MDITMPEMDGIQAVKEIKKINDGARIIMCSAMVSSLWLSNPSEAGGAKDFIVKPFQADRVLEAVKKVLA